MRTPVVVVSIATLAVGLSACGGTDVFDIPVGACLDSAALEGDQVAQIETLECTVEHDVETYASLELSGDSYPGQDEILAQADEFCLAEFETFIGTAYQDSELDFSFLYPTEESWGTGDREVLCLVISPEPVTGTLEGTAR
ncbi:MAG: septum formation family protein [Actinomycetota bacterium]